MDQVQVINMNKLLTFSIAAYNVEKTLPKLMDSLLAIQARDKIEILIVNDGSTDQTLEISESYKRDNLDCVKVINKENGGHGSTINVGIKNATGKFFRPIDGDDWIDTGNMDKLIAKLNDVDSDIVLTNFYKCHEDSDGQDIFRYELASSYELESGKTYELNGVVANISTMRYHTMMYRTDLLRDNNVKLSEHCFYVDTELNLLPLIYVKDITYFNYPIYCYRYGCAEQSVSRTSRQKHIGDSKKVAERLLAFYRDNKAGLAPGLRQYLKNGARGICMWHYVGLTYFGPNKANRRALADFDNYVYSVDPEIHRAMLWDIRHTGKRGFLAILMMRGARYMLYPVAVKLFR